MTIPEQPDDTSGHLRRAQHRQALRALRRERSLVGISREVQDHLLAEHGRKCPTIGEPVLRHCACWLAIGVVCPTCDEVLLVFIDAQGGPLPGVPCEHRKLRRAPAGFAIEIGGRRWSA